jgi:hypothetical protein
MTGETARAITLVTYGNAFLKHDRDITSLTLGHPSFQFANRVEFLVYDKPWIGEAEWKQYAADTIDWLQKLKAEGIQRLRYVVQPGAETHLGDELVPTHKLAGFVGGGVRQIIEVVNQGHSDFWTSNEEVTDLEAKDRRIWDINYRRIAAHQPSTQKQKYKISDISKRLGKVLAELREFAVSIDKYWADFFAAAQLTLTKATEREPNGDELPVPVELMTEAALRLLAASKMAWCFGGMGSWNDIVVEDKKQAKQYEKLSGQLYGLLVESYVAIANSIE